MRHAAGMSWRASAREARHREIEAAPEKMYRAGLAQKAGAKFLEHAICTKQDLEKAADRIRIVGGMFDVLRKPDRIRQFVGVSSITITMSRSASAAIRA